MKISQYQPGKNKKHTDNMVSTEFFSEIKNSFNAGEYRNKIAKQNCPGSSDIMNRNIPDHKTNNRSAKPQV